MSQKQQSLPPVRLIGTANHGFAQYAQEEVRRLLPDAKFAYLEPGEVFLIRTETAAEEAQQVLRAQEPIFLRHLQPVHGTLPIDRSADDLMRAIELVQGLHLFQPGEKLAVQVRKAQGLDFGYTPYGMKEAIDPILVQQHEVEPVVREADRILSLYLTADTLHWGLSRPEDNLSDWSGGAVRYQREEGLISRAKFKLLEAEERFHLDFRTYEVALDVGAAPGGWTSLLLERGLAVTAIDPGLLHESLQQHPKLTYLRKNAGEVALADETFDLLVCDMSWSPKQMAKLVADLLPALVTGGTALITVKLMHKKPFQTVRETMEVLGDGMQLLHAKQLFHNREELTLHLIKL